MRVIIEDFFNEDILWILRVLFAIAVIISMCIATYMAFSYLEDREMDTRWICPDGGIVVRLDSEGRRFCIDGLMYEPTLEKYED